MDKDFLMDVALIAGVSLVVTGAVLRSPAAGYLTGQRRILGIV